MGFERGFLDYDRIEPAHRKVSERIKDFREYTASLSDEEVKIQAGRCMDCGIPFCMNQCPLHNIMPDFNQFACEGDFLRAYSVLSSTNNFPEFTGRLCPALCEDGCTLGIHRKQVGIKSIERKIAEYAFDHGMVKAVCNLYRSFKKVAVVGSGPAALACAQQLSRLGHNVTVYEKNDKIGGLLRYGIPDFKLPKEILDRRLAQLELEGISFRTSVMVGKRKNLEKGIHCDATTEISGQELLAQYDAVVLAPGSEVPIDLRLPGRDLSGIHYALDFLIAENREINGAGENPIRVKNKKVVIIGGGDTAADCVGVAVRKGAAEVTEIELAPELPESVNLDLVWPDWRRIKRPAPSLEEGCNRIFSTNTTAFKGVKGHVTALQVQQVKWEGRKFAAVSGTEKELKADIVLLAIGYSRTSEGLPEEFGLDKDQRGNIKAAFEGPEAFRTSNPKVFAAGDGRRGQSLVVHAIADGRRCAAAVNRYLREAATPNGAAK